MRFFSPHTHTTLCEVKWCGIGRPPKPWCMRFYSKIEMGGQNECWWWLPEKRAFERCPNIKHGNLNFTCNFKKLRQIKPARMLWWDQIGKPMHSDNDPDHICQNYWCMNIAHIQEVHWLENSGKLNKERGVYSNRIRDPHGRYYVPGTPVRPTATMGRKKAVMS